MSKPVKRRNHLKEPGRLGWFFLSRSMGPDDQLPTRASLLERLKDLDDQRSWMEFYQAYHDLLFSVARRAGLTEQEAEEAVQETLISVARKMPGFTYDPSKDSFKGWLLTVTRWRVRDQWQRRRRAQAEHGVGPHPEPGLPEEGTAPIERVPDPGGMALDALWDEEWEKHLLQKALARIKRAVHPQHYEIYHLYVVLGKSVEEVKTTLGVSSGQVYLAKYRVGTRLRREVQSLQEGLRL
jgi:RNA polymerase sigma factor (sigma-70 family)